MSATSDTPSRILTRTPSSMMTGYTESTIEAFTGDWAGRPAAVENRNAKANETWINNCDPPWKSGVGSRESGVWSRESGSHVSDDRFLTPDSRLPTPDSRLQTPDSRLPTPDLCHRVALDEIVIAPISYQPSGLR